MSKSLEEIYNLIEDRKGLFHQDKTVVSEEKLSADGNYPYQDGSWLKIPNISCVFVDIKNSTQLNAVHHDKSTASVYELFTGTGVRIFDALGAEYIDIKGDGIFALFSEDANHRALVAAVTFNTFAIYDFLPLVRRKLGDNVDLGVHIGIDRKTVLVKQVGIKDAQGRDRRKNEVWAGKPINMASKLASLSDSGQIFVSDRFHDSLQGDKFTKASCGCVVDRETRAVEQAGNPSQPLWIDALLEESGKTFDFNQAYRTDGVWCPVHGEEWFNQILALDSN